MRRFGVVWCGVVWFGVDLVYIIIITIIIIIIIIIMLSFPEISDLDIFREVQGRLTHREFNQT